MRRDPLIDERALDGATDRYVAWREECDVVRDAYERWTRASGADAAQAFAEYQAALDREGHIAEVYGDLMARVVIELEPCSEPGREPLADDRPQRDLLACVTGEQGLVWYAVAWVGAWQSPLFSPRSSSLNGRCGGRDLVPRGVTVPLGAACGAPVTSSSRRALPSTPLP
jgi:hypothetical protein